MNAETAPLATPKERSRQRALIVTLCALAIAFGAIHAWAGRFDMNPDGISYLDMAEAYYKGDWGTAINAYWSPLYAWVLGLAMVILKPSSYWQFPVAHLANLAAYLFCLSCFGFFMRQVVRSGQLWASELEARHLLAIPQPSLLVLGFAFFVYTSLSLIGLSRVTPDILVAGFVYLASGLLLQIRIDRQRWTPFLFLGIVLGLAYYAKAPMLLVALVFLTVAGILAGLPRRADLRLLIALVASLIIVLPLVGLLSSAKGRLTFGDSGKLNYAWYVNGANPFHWQGDLPTIGTPAHPVRMLRSVPALYEFASPIGGTYPAWYDPSYWNEGISPHFQLSQQINQITNSLRDYIRLFCSDRVFLVVVTSFSILYLYGFDRWSSLRWLGEGWFLYAPAIGAFAMYSLVHVESRFIGAFVTVLLVGLFSCLRLPDSTASKKLAMSVTTIIVVVILAIISLLTISVLQGVPRDRENAPVHVQWQVARDLADAGVQPGDRIGFIGDSFDAYWARLAKARIIAEIPSEDANAFWQATLLTRSQIMETLAGVGARFVVTRNAPPLANSAAEGWLQVGDTGYYIHPLPQR